RYQGVVDELRDLIEGRYGTPPRPVDPTVRRVVSLLGGDEPPPADPAEAIDELRERYPGLASSEEELLLLALFPDEAEDLLRAIRGRGRREEPEDRLEAARTERIRELVRLVQESGVAEGTVEDEGMRVSVRRTEERAVAPVATALATGGEDAPAAMPAAAPPAEAGVLRVESPMVGTFYRAPEPDAPPFVEVGDAVAIGQTLCILEAMKLMNEVKAEVEGIVRRVCVGNAEPVEYGQILFELEPLDGRPPLL